MKVFKFLIAASVIIINSSVFLNPSQMKILEMLKR